MIELMIGNIPVGTELDSDKRIKSIFIKKIISIKLLMGILLENLRSLFEWTVEKEYFELVMSICTQLEV